MTIDLYFVKIFIKKISNIHGLPRQTGQHFPSSNNIWSGGHDRGGQSVLVQLTKPSSQVQDLQVAGMKTSPCVRAGVRSSSAEQGSEEKYVY